MCLAEVVPDACSGEEACPEGFHCHAVYNGNVHDISDSEVGAKIAAGCRIVDKAVYDMTGLIGTSTALQLLFRRHLSRHRSDTRASVSNLSIVSDGIINARRVLLNGTSKLTRAGLEIRRTKDILPLLATKYDTFHEKDKAAFLHHMLQMRSLHCIDVAYVKQEFLNVLKEGKSLVQAIFATQIAADRVDLGMISHDDIRLSIDTCTTEQERAVTEHPCIHCGDIDLCSKMYRAGDGGTYDKKCFDRLGALPSVRYTVQASLQTLLYDIRRSGDLSMDLEAVKKKLVEAHVLEGGTAYLDGYDGRVDNAFTVIQSPGLLIRLDKHSVEKPFSVMGLNGKTALHSVVNAILCRDVFNRFKGQSIVAIMGWVADLLALQNVVKHLPPKAEYHDEVREKLLAWDAFSDNTYLIRIKVQYRNMGRQQEDFTPEEWNNLKSEFVSGIWDGYVQPGQGQRLWRAFHNQTAEVPGNNWDDTVVAILKKDIDDMQASSKFNPHQLMLPRGDDGLPCLWRSDLLPPDISWAWVNRVFRARYCRWRDKCNRGRPTKESAATLLLLYVLWWFRTGGKCHIFGFIMTLFHNYDTNFSFGRGVWYFNANGKETDEAIVAGTTLVSGFTDLLPTDVHTQFDWTEMTAMVESWKANSTRYNLPVALYPELFARFKLVSPQTEWYHSSKTRAEYTQQELPKPPRLQDLPEPDEEAEDHDEEAQVFLAAIQARENPAEEDRVTAVQERDDGEDADEALEQYEQL